MNNVTLTADTPFFQSVNYDHDARRAELATEQAYRDVWLYDRDDEARKRVEANTNAAMYALPSMQDKKGMALWGREHARMVAPHLADTPVELAQNMRDRLVDAGMKERYTAQMQELEASGKDSADDWYSLYAGMYRDVEQKAWADARAREAAVADSLDRLGAYISGADLTPDEEEGKGFSQKDVDNVRSVLPAAEMAALDDMRAFARTYLRGLEQLEDGAAIVRGLDALEDELHELVGQDENKAALMYNTVMDWAQRVADSDKIGAGDEFLLSIGNKLRTWGQERPRAMFAAVPAVGAAGAINTGALSSAAETIQEAGKEGKERELSRGILRAGAAKARTIGRNTGWWKGALRMGPAMAGDSAMYLVPVVGGALGTIDTLSTGLTDVPDMARAAGATDFGAGTQAMVGTSVQAAVELMPFGKVGGKGLSAFVRKVFGESVAKGTSGALAKWVVRHTQKSTMRALAAEAGAGMVEEALVEPLVGGVLSLGLEEAVYALGAPQGEQSRKWTEHFAELSSMLTDPQQLAGLAIFTAALTGASAPAIRRNVKYFERSRNMWEAAGLKPEQVEEVLVSKTPMQTGRELLEQEEEQDAAGLWERRAKANEKILAEGKVLFMTGQSEADMEAPELAQAYAAAWQEGVQAGVLPEVKANEDGTFTVRERGKAGKEDKVLVLTPAAADAYLQAAIEREEKAQFEQLKQELGEQGAREKAPNLRALVQIGVAEIAGEAMRRKVAAHGRFDVADVEKQLPEHLAKLVRMRGGIDRMLAARISDWARGRVAALMEGGMSERDARASKDYAAGAVRSLGDWTGFAESFVHRTEKLANRDSVVTQVFRAQNNDVALVDGATVLGSTIFNVRGKGRAFGWLEDTTESVVDQLIQAREAKIYEEKKGEGMTRAEAERQALNELGEQVARARAAVLKADPSVKIFEVKKDDRMSVIEAFSDISNSAFLTSGVVPKWMRPMAEMMKANVVAANTALTLAKAWEAAIEADPEAVQDMRKVLEEVGIDVRDIVEETNISAEDIETWKMARAEARAVAYGPRGVGGEAVSEVVQQAEAEEAAIRAKEAPVSEERKEEVQAEVRAQEEHVERVYQDADEDAGSAPEEVCGVFVGDSCVYNAAGGFYMGLIDKSKLRDGIEQVKVGAKGKHGVIAGRELVGDFQASAAPLYVWKRKNGELWLISGSHRFELLLRDNGVSSHACYVFVEDAEHDEKWARMMDYENNMRDDQADEVTAAMYVRETGYGDAELRKRGLLRNESRSKRGALIGRWAREELWTRFVNGAVKPMDAEIICNLTKNLRDASRVEEIQRRCCMLLDEGKGWEYIGAMVQLMANKESVFLKQGLLDLGADFEADLARAAAWIEKNLRKLNEAISLVKQGRKLSGKKREEAERLGIATQMEGGEDLLADLEGLRAKFEMVGSYPDLVAQAQLYDGKTEVDPVGQLLEQQRAQREREQGLKELDAEAYLRAKQAEAVPEFGFSVESEMEDIKAAAEKDGTFMTAPNGKPTNLTERQWLQVRTKAFKEWFGDWEKVARFRSAIDKLRSMDDVCAITGDEFAPDGRKLTDKVTEFWSKEYGGVAKNPILGEVILDTRSVKASIAHGVGRLKSAAFAVVHDVIEQGVLVEIAPNWKGRGDDSYVIAAPVQIGGVSYVCEVVVMKGETRTGFYLHEVQIKEKLLDVFKTGVVTGTSGAPQSILLDVWNRVKKIEENCSKVVDENGEPRVVYHGTVYGGFTIFDDYAKEGLKYSDTPDGAFYFISDMNSAHDYSKGAEGYARPGSMVYSVFLNIRNPKTVDFNASRWNWSESKAFLIQNGKRMYNQNGDYFKNTSEARKYAKENKLERAYAFYETTDTLAQQAIEEGYDGAIFTNVIDDAPYPKVKGKKVNDYVVFSSNQIKSATDNRGTFDGSSGDITMSTEYEPRNLAAVHSIPVDTMLDVEKKLGGLPKPSIAITRLDKPYSWGYSERVYLIGKPELADPQKGNLVYDRDAWTGKGPFLLEGGGAYDYRKGEYFEPTLEEFVARTIKKKGQEDGSSFRGQSAVAIGTMDAVKAHREKLSDTDTANAQKAETDEALEELIENVVKLSKKGLNEDAVAMVLARVCWRSSPMNHGAPSEMKTSRDTAKRILNELGVRVKDIKKPLVDSFMKAVAGLQNELEDYLESVPQRAVMFNEWEYAVMPESMKGTPGLDEMLERNGIKPVWHDGTEGGRRAALAGLVDDSKVSFSVVGEHAANWDELKERAFKGRDDGKLRVELDASGAKLKGGKHGQDAKVLAPRFRALVEFIREKINANRRWNAVVTDWKDNVPSIDSWEEVSFVRRVLEKAGITYQNLGALVNSGILLAVLEPKEEHIGAFLDKVERIDSLSGFDALEDVLDYPELYKAYPQLRKVPILWKKDAANRGLTSLSGTGDLWITIRDGEDAERTLSTLLHETQHVIQFIEGFAVGGSGSFADMRAWMSDNGYLDQSLLLTNAELYRRLAGEIEARNVQKRAGWDANVRQYYIPFNDTLEYAGQAIVIKASDLGYDNVSLSLTVEAQNALHLLEKRRDEVEAQVILEDMQKACERLSVVLAADDDPQVGNGLQVYAEMQALISATRKALPGKYLRQGNLNGLLAWAGVYARMAQNGAMPKRGAIKGEIYDRFVTELGKKNERMQLQGMSADEAREVMMGLGSTRLEEAFLKVGRDCAKRLDAFLKDRALERIEYLHEMVYPKREPGQAWTRGKMDTTAYLLVEKVRAIIAGSRERRAKLEEELREKGREMRRVREAMESGQMEEELGARKLTVMRGQMELMELNAMAEAAAKHAKTLEQLDQELAELDQAAEDYAQREREINEEVALLKTFGNWYYKDAGEAVRAARVFEDIILRGKADWEDKLKLERERRAWLKAQIASHFTTADPDVENVRADDRAAFKGTMGSKAKAMAKGVMSFGHMLIYLRKKLGREFCDDQRAKLARIHDGFMGFNRELDGWMYRTLRDITGLDTKEAQEVWLTQMEEVNDTGIMVTNSRREKIVLSYAEAKRWLGLNKKAFEQERARMLAEAAQAKRKPMNVPTAEVMDELRELYLAYEADHRGVDEDKKQFHLTHEETWEEELRTTKGVLLFFLLTFEQPDYEHLLEANGMSGATLDQIRRYIGPTMVRWGYAMRNKLNEHGQLVAEVFERYTGIPFGARESYFKGVFDTGAMKERDERAAIEQGSAGAGTRTKYGSLIPRRYHKARVERVSATQVFVQAMQQQNNYVQTAEFVREWRGLLTDKEFAKRMEAELGADTMQMLRGCIETLEGAAAGDAAAARAATGVISKMLSGYAVTRLAGNVYSIIKQVSAILNAMAGGYVPEKMVEHGVLVQDMALRKVGFGEFLRSLARVLTLRGAIGKSEVARQEYILGRKLYEGKGLAHTAMLEANQKVAGYEPAGGWLGWTAVPNAIWSWLGQKSEKVKELGMEALGFMDAEMCTLSAMALADAVYRQGKAEDKEGLVPDELLRARALQLAGMALDIAAQPQVRTQKGYWAASGAFGALAPTLYMFRSDTLSKVGLWGAQMASGEKLPAATSFLAFGVLNALVLALLRMMRGDLPDDDDEVKEMAVEFALNVLTNDASSLPLVGETIGTLRNTLQGKHWAAQGGLGEMVLPFVTLGTDIYREVRNIDKDAPLDKHWATVGRLLRSLGASAAIFHESTTGPLANASSIAAAAAVAGNMSMVVKGLIKAMEDAED